MNDIIWEGASWSGKTQFSLLPAPSAPPSAVMRTEFCKGIMMEIADKDLLLIREALESKTNALKDDPNPAERARVTAFEHLIEKIEILILRH